ncbi:GNAT family N-acetyltransferase [Actinacidiphila paucisporea]|uniref:Protein N-acetyltransferase, RimJ/RimL family n=1 Tax=Actinacidiphila paucisporea TaxID=310782 RepID=A0A1M7BZA8_9ACTN|nr:GNAT family protein [Actinacidiphila paucisporea]SHL59919.1 Protein N-acetyltransferase, RimJ/RimL family [Actinacidiphila paucisporea]
MSDVDDVLLRPVGEGDLPTLTGMLNSPEARAPFQWFGWLDPARTARGWAENGLLGPDNGLLMVATATEPLGFVSWRKIDASGYSYFWNIGILLLPDARGRGVGTRAQRLLVDYLFAHTPVVRIEADTEATNFPEQRALEKAGFTREGVLRSVVFRDGRWRDAMLYSIIRDDVDVAAAGA